MKRSQQFIAAIAGALFIAITPLAFGQEQTLSDQIAESQGGASSLTYTIKDKKIPLIEVGTFNNVNECNVRGGLPNFFSKVASGKDVTVAFLGGSITQGDYCYRLQTNRYMENKYPGVKFNWVNAGVSGTGTDLGAFRMKEQVLQYKPDLIFIEFAVNGAYPDAMEGIIRKAIKVNPNTDICLIYTLNDKQVGDYQMGDYPKAVKKLDEIAAYYQLPSIHLGMEAAELEKEGKLLFKGSKSNADGKIVFSNDGVHPIVEGGNLYAASIARGLDKMQKSGAKKQAHILPKPMFGTEWENAEMYVPSQIATYNSAWREVQSDKVPALRKFSDWFDTVLTSSKADAYFSFGFDGDMIGLFDIGGPEAGQVEVMIDGKLVQLKKKNANGFQFYEANDREGTYTLDRFNQWCNNRYRGQHDVIKLDPGAHQVTIRISPIKADKKAILGKKTEDITQNPEKYDRTVLYLGRILLRGKPIPTVPVKGVPKLVQQRKWDQKMSRYERLDSITPPVDDLILFVGSSTIENWKTVETDFPGKVVLNRGVSGSKTIDLINYKDRLITPYNPKKIFIYEGDNDIGYKWSSDEILAQFKKLFFMIRAEKPRAELIYISIKPSIRRMKDKDRIEEINGMIKEFIEKQPNAAFADVYHPMLKPNGELYPEHYREDGLHLTPEGYAIWKEVISKYIK